MDLLRLKIRQVHMIGIKGTGMSALAVNLKSTGIKVTGSDYAESFFTDNLLKKHSIKVISPFSPSNISRDTDLVIVSTAYNNKNEEVQEAHRRKLKTLTYPEVLGLLTRQLSSVAVCGSHGKTTTSGALAYVLSKTSYNPIVNVGSIVPQLLNYRSQNPKLFVFEADEYQNKLQYFYPKIVILTNIDYDHPDYFRNPRHYKSVFQKFIKRIPRSGLLIYCADDKNCRDVVKNTRCKKISYGFSKSADCLISVNKIDQTKMNFSIYLVVELLSLLSSSTTKSTTKSKLAENWSLATKLIGKHNALNLTAAALCAAALGLLTAEIKKAVASFTGTKRRLEVTKKCKINGHSCTIIDDFGHHPTEIKNTIATLKTAYPDKTLWTVFQPHTFSRTEALFDDFTHAFDKSDKTIVLDIYASKRETTGKIHSRDLINKMGGQTYYQPDIKKAAAFLKKKISSDSIILTIGASEVWRLAQLL